MFVWSIYSLISKSYNSVFCCLLDFSLNACKDIGLAVNTRKTKGVQIGRHRGIIANEHNQIERNSSEKVKTFKYLGSLLTNQNFIQEEIKCRLKAGNSCYYSVQTLLSSRFLSKNFKIKIYKTIILPVVLYGCETWSLILREECRLRVFEANIWFKMNENGEWRWLHNEQLHTWYC